MVYSAFVGERTTPGEESMIASRFENGSDIGSGRGYLGVEQDTTISSSSSQETGIGVLGGGSTGSSSSLSEMNESDLKSVIDLLEEKVNGEEGGNQAIPVVQNGAVQASAHSVEYWSVSQGKPKTFLKRYSVNRQSRHFRNSRRGNNQLFGSSGGLHEPNFVDQLPPPLFNANNFLPLPAPHIPALINPPLLPNPSPLHVYAPQAPAPAHQQQISVHVFMPPEQWTTQMHPPPFMSAIQVGQVPPQSSPVYPVPQPQHIHYYSGPVPQNGFQLPLASSSSPPPPVSYYQGAPLFYQVPQIPMSPLNHLGQLFPNDFGYFGGYERPLEYPPPPPYEDAIMSSPNVEQSAGIEVDSNTNAVEAMQDNHWDPQNFMTPLTSPVATPSSSDTSLSGMGHNGLCEAPDSTTSGYSSCTASPEQTSTIVTGTHEFGTTFGNLTNTAGNSSSEEGVLEVNAVPNEEVHAELKRGGNGNKPGLGLERYSIEVRALNDAILTAEMQETMQGTVTSFHNHCQPQQQHVYVYPGACAFLVYSPEDGHRSVNSYNEQEIPFVTNGFDFRAHTSFKEQSGPALNYSYYVPPRTADNDFFGGQLPIWQVKMLQYFIKYQPDNWKLHGVPETFNIELFFGNMMDSVGEFHIVSKLRFSCRTCKTAWTSKKGTIVFKFCYNSALKQGWILLRIFGQICMRQECSDWTFQNPACYPEEIDRAMMKLSEYIGNQCYGIAVTPSCFDECFKSIRKNGNVGRNTSGSKERERARANLPPTPHKREFCQACINGVCKNLFAKPFPVSSRKRAS